MKTRLPRSKLVRNQTKLITAPCCFQAQAVLLSLLVFVELLETCVIRDGCDGELYTVCVKQLRRVSSLGGSMTNLVIS